MGQTQRDTLLTALKSWAETARANQMRPWLMYFTGSQRVFDGFIRYDDKSVAVEPSEDFALNLGAACTNLGIGFINTFPALRRAAEAGPAPYNLVGDGHLSRDGSRIVAEILAEALQSSYLDKQSPPIRPGGKKDSFLQPITNASSTRSSQ